MAKRNELSVRGDEIGMRNLKARFKHTDLLEDWKRNEESEAKLHSNANSIVLYEFCFDLTQGPLRPVTLLLQAISLREMQVTGIMSTDRKPLSDTEYNRVLGDFLSNVLIPLGVGLNLEFAMKPPRAELGEWISHEAMDRLREFLVASTSDGGLWAVPELGRWTQFVIQIHRDDSYVDSENLDYWLKLHGFQDDDRNRLLDNYSQTSSVLTEYDRERVH